MLDVRLIRRDPDGVAAALARRDRLLPGTPDAAMDAVVVTEARVVGEVSLDGDAPVPDEDGTAETAEPEGHTAEAE